MEQNTLIELLAEAAQRSFVNQEAIDHKIEEIAEIEERCNLYFDRSTFRNTCATCPNVCCTRSILNYLKNKPQELYYVAKQNPEYINIIKNNTPQTDMCILLGPQGCLLSRNGRPKLCIGYVCQAPYKQNMIQKNNELAQRFMELRELMEVDQDTTLSIASTSDCTSATV